MFIELSSIPFGEEQLFEGIITDKNLLSEKLGVEPASDFSFELLASKNNDELHVKLSVKGDIHSRCDLCGEETVAKCKSQLEEIFYPDDSEFDFVKKGYDLHKFIEDCIVLSLPRTARCRPDCKGLCLKCGANLNYEKCRCKKTLEGENNPFGVLQDIILTEGAKNGSTKK